MAFTGGTGRNDWIALARNGCGNEEYVDSSATYLSGLTEVTGPTEGTKEIRLRGYKDMSAGSYVVRFFASGVVPCHGLIAQSEAFEVTDEDMR